MKNKAIIRHTKKIQRRRLEGINQAIATFQFIREYLRDISTVKLK